MSVRKSYFATTVEAALALARQELGEDALLLESRPAQPQDRHLGAYCVTFETAGNAESGASAQPGPSGDNRRRWRSDHFGTPELSGFHAELARLSSVVAQLTAQVCCTSATAELAPVATQLVASDVPSDLVCSILQRVERRLGLLSRMDPPAPGSTRRALAEEIGTRLRTDSSVGRPEAQRRVVALVGPPGVGKTTTLAKLALRLAVSARVPAMIVTTDTYRIAAAEQLRAYAAILGLPFQVAETPGALSRALEEHRQKELVFIDSPGFGPREPECVEEWAALLGGHSEIETQLVLSATTRSSDLIAATRRWEIFAPSKLIFTHLDETSACGGCIAAAMTSGKPVSYLCAGQGVPEDIEPACTERLLQLLLGEGERARAAAA